jgi:SAM-dependent methyltransferase
MVRADRDVDRLYAQLRARYGTLDAHANGYRWRGWFAREQALVQACLREARDPIVDLGCGSGLMLAPLAACGRAVIGLDFNAEACRAARAHRLLAVRGDAFRLPFADSSLGAVVSCQFFNQQSTGAVAAFLEELARVLGPGGRAVLVWRNGTALVHRFAHALFAGLDRVRGLPVFPCVDHALGSVMDGATARGLAIDAAFLSFPPLGWRLPPSGSLRGGVFGASCVLVLMQPVGAGAQRRVSPASAAGVDADRDGGFSR